MTTTRKAPNGRSANTTAHATGEPEVLGDVGNGGAELLAFSEPYMVTVDITGTCPIIFHRWDCDSVEAKAKAAKNSAAKKTDDVESYVWRDDDGLICLPGVYLRQSLIDPQNGAAKYRQDPRSPRKSALDLFKAGVVAITDLAPIRRADGTTCTEWDYIDRRRVQVQRNGITRERPAFRKGWRAEVQLMVNTPEYISPADLHDVLINAGRLVGLADYRPTFGRFQVDHFTIGLTS